MTISEVFWFFTLFQGMMKAKLILGNHSGNTNFSITVERGCNSERDHVIFPTRAGLWQNISCLKRNGERKTNLQCFCQKNSTFIAAKQTCVRNDVLVKKYNCNPVQIHPFDCDGLKESSFTTTDIIMTDSKDRDVSVKGKVCKPSKSATSKYLDCGGFWKNLSHKVVYKIGNGPWLKTYSVETNKEMEGTKHSLFKEVQGRLIKVALECEEKIEGPKKIHNECILIKAKGRRTCHFQVTSPTSTTVTTAQMKSSPETQSDDIEIKYTTKFIFSSKFFTTSMIHPTISSSSGKEVGAPNKFIFIVIGVVMGVCVLLILVCCLVFGKQKVRKEKSVYRIRRRCEEQNELRSTQQESCYEEPLTSEPQGSNTVDLCSRNADQTVSEPQNPTYRGKETEDTEDLGSGMKPGNISHYSFVEVRHLDELSTNYYDLEDEGYPMPESNEGRKETSLPCVVDAKESASSQQRDYESIPSNQFKTKSFSKSKEDQEIAETLYETPLKKGNEHFENNASSSRIVPQKPAPYATTQYQHLKLPTKDTVLQAPQVTSEKGNNAKVLKETQEYETVNLANQPVIEEFNVYDEAEKIIKDGETASFDENHEAKEDVTKFESQETASYSSTTSDSQFSRKGDFCGQSDESFYYDPGEIICGDTEEKTGNKQP